MSTLALPTAPTKQHARARSNRWAEGDSLIQIPGLGDVIAHGFLAKLRGINIDKLMSQATERSVLTAGMGGTAWTVAGAFLALTTSAVANTDTSASLVEPTYTGYGRQNVAGAMGAATGGNPASITNSSAITFAACTAGSGTIIGFAVATVVTTGGAGAVIFYGTCTSVTVSTTQTPATVPISGLVATLT